MNPTTRVSGDSSLAASTELVQGNPVQLHPAGQSGTSEPRILSLPEAKRERRADHRGALDLRARIAPPAEAIDLSDLRECEEPGCGLAFPRDQMQRLPDGTWLCSAHAAAHARASSRISSQLLAAEVCLARLRAVDFTSVVRERMSLTLRAAEEEVEDLQYVYALLTRSIAFPPGEDEAEAPSVTPLFPDRTLPTLPVAIDPARLARAVHLRAAPFSTPGLYAIEGGSRVHAVDVRDHAAPACHCEDRIKGFCKHILAALIADGEPTVLAAAKALVASGGAS
jgi:hypothetical protein